jgi:hypothetical protein
MRHRAKVARRVLRALALSAMLSGCSGSRVADPSSRYLAVHNVMRAMGLHLSGAITQGTLAKGQEARLALALPATCVTVVALGGAGVVDLGLVLADPEGKIVAEERARDAEAVVRACPEQPGTYFAVLRMTEGAGEYLVSSWRGGDPTTPEAGSALASGGTCDAPTLIMSGHSYAGTTEGASDEHQGSCSAGQGGRERVYRLDLPRRQRVTLDVNADFDSVLYVRDGDCEDESSEVRCNDDSGPKRSTIDAVFDPGTYFVFVDGYGEEVGNYHLRVSAQDAPTLGEVCRDARPLVSSSRLAGSVTDTFDNTHATCGRDAHGADVPFRFDLPARMRVRVVEKSADFRPVVHVRHVCEAEASEVGCSDSGFAEDEATWAGVLDAGTYWVFADSSDEATPGGFSLAAETAPENGTMVGGGSSGDGCGDAVALTGSSGKIEGDTFAAHDDVSTSCAPSGAADVVYRFDLPHKSHVSARLVGDESSHALALERACGDRASEVACGAVVDRLIDAGTYFLVVDGARAESLGKFAFSYKVRDLAELETACARVPSLAFDQSISGTTAGSGDKFSSACGARGIGQGSPDRVYRVRVPRRMGVRLTAEAQGFRGVVSLRRACADDTTELGCAQAGEDGGRAQAQAVLDPGVYYAVIDGVGSSAGGPFLLRLDGFDPNARGPEPSRRPGSRAPLRPKPTVPRP